ncbi:MAG: hypothetical protein ACRDNT_00520 [Streptosporangiaceae bacterium]
MHNLTDPPASSAEAITELRLAALERQVAGLAGQLRLAEEQNLALEERVTQLAADLERCAQDAATLRSARELRQEYSAIASGSRSRRPRHLQAVRGAR